MHLYFIGIKKFLLETLCVVYKKKSKVKEYSGILYNDESIILFFTEHMRLDGKKNGFYLLLRNLISDNFENIIIFFNNFVLFVHFTNIVLIIRHNSILYNMI